MKEVSRNFSDRINKLSKQTVNTLSLLYALLCWISLSTLGIRMPVIFRVILCAVVFVGGMHRGEIVNCFNAASCNKAIKSILLVLLYMYTTFAFCGIYVIDVDKEFKFHGNNLSYFIIAFIWCRIFARTVIWGIKNVIPTKRETNHYWRKFAVIFCIGIILSCIWLYAFNPAITSVDSQGLYQQALEVGMPDFTMNDWQPPMYVFLLSLLQKVWNNITFMVVLQLIFFWSVVADGILFLYKEGAPKWLLVVVYAYFTLGYSNQIQLVTFWKDIPFGITIMWLTLLLVKLIWHGDKYIVKWYYYVELFVCLFFTAFLRQNGILAVGVLIILLPVLFRNIRFVIVSVVMIATIIVVKGPIYKANNVIPQPSLKYFAMVNDISYSYYNGVQVDTETKALVERMIAAESYRSNITYSPYYSEFVHADLADYSVPRFLVLYLRNMKDHPREVLIALLKRTQIIWSVPKNDTEITNCLHYIGEQNTLDPPIYPKRVNIRLTELLTGMVLNLKSNMEAYIICWRPGIYNLFIIISIVTLILFGGKKKLGCLLPVIPIAFNVFALYISSAWTDYRYHWPSVIVCYLIVGYCMITNKACYGGRITEWN